MADASNARSNPEKRVLVLVRGAHEGDLTRRLLEQARIGSDLCRDAVQLCDELEHGAGALLLAEEVLTAPLLKQLAQVLSAQEPWSDLPILIFSAPRDDNTRGAASAALGNVTFLDRPLHVRTMVAAVQSALRSRERQYEARRAIESRDAFLAMLGHELRNPLGVALQAREANPEPARWRNRSRNIVRPTGSALRTRGTGSRSRTWSRVPCERVVLVGEGGRNRFEIVECLDRWRIVRDVEREAFDRERRAVERSVVAECVDGARGKSLASSVPNGVTNRSAT
ncbi:MAG: hypothetical protein QM756_20595 [Polyangiaceae bacterium]